MVTTIILLSLLAVVLATAIILLVRSIFSVQQGTVSIVTRFGKFKRVAITGLNFKHPLFDRISNVISLQNRSAVLDFQAVTQDQANVFFKAMILYSVLNSNEDTVKNVAFKFRSESELGMALNKTIEGIVRAFVASLKQAEILSLRKEIVSHVKGELDSTLNDWGYHLIDVQINDITFDKRIMESMSEIVASNNMKAAAENEGQALLITKTKTAEAEGTAIKIAAEAEKEAARLRGEGIALFREQVAKGMSAAAEEMKQANLDTDVILFGMWTDTLKEVAEKGKGNIIFLDGSTDGMQKTVSHIRGLMAKNIIPIEPSNE